MKIRVLGTGMVGNTQITGLMVEAKSQVISNYESVSTFKPMQNKIVVTNKSRGFQSLIFDKVIRTG